MNTSMTRTAATAAVITVALAGCGSADQEPANDVVSSAPSQSQAPATADETTAGGESTESSQSSPASPSSPPASDGEAMDSLAESPSATAEQPQWDSQAEADAGERALSFMRAFSRPDLPREEWFAGIRGYLSQNGEAAYETVDPSRVPATEVTGEPTVRESGSASVAIVEITTDAGGYEVTLSRVTDADSWHVEYAEPQF